MSSLRCTAVNTSRPAAAHPTTNWTPPNLLTALQGHQIRGHPPGWWANHGPMASPAVVVTTCLPVSSCVAATAPGHRPAGPRRAPACGTEWEEHAPLPASMIRSRGNPGVRWAGVTMTRADPYLPSRTHRAHHHPTHSSHCEPAPAGWLPKAIWPDRRLLFPAIPSAAHPSANSAPWVCGPQRTPGNHQCTPHHQPSRVTVTPSPGPPVSCGGPSLR